MKKLLYLTAVAACFILVSCSSVPTPTPSGDGKKDAEVLAEYFVKAYADAKQAIKDGKASKLAKIKNEIEATKKNFEDYLLEVGNEEYAEAFSQAGIATGVDLDELDSEMKDALENAPEEFLEKFLKELENNQ